MVNLTVEFLHPGLEANLKNKEPVSINDAPNYADKHYIYPIVENKEIGVRFWNCYRSHKKKCLLSQGKYLKRLPFNNLDDVLLNDYNKPPESGCLSFWGEWEPQSFFKLIHPDKEDSPKQIHFPFFIKSTPADNGLFHSTDPYVFGKTFLYTHCLQGPRSDGKPKRTDRYLKSPDLKMILYGYEFPFSENPNDFLLDTLIVIDKTKQNDTFGKFSEVFELANLRFTNNYNYKYQGVMYSDKNGIFSFVPCKLYDKSNLFCRKEAKLNWKSLRLQKPGARQGLTEIDTFSNDDLIIFWKKVVNTIIDNGLSLGVEFAEPKYFQNYPDTWNYYNSDENECKI